MQRHIAWYSFLLVIINLSSMEKKSERDKRFIPSLLEKSIPIVAQDFDARDKLMFSAGNVCEEYELLHSAFFSKIPDELGQRIRDYCACKYGFFEKPYNLKTIKLDNEIVLSMASRGSLCALSGIGSIFLMDSVTGEIKKLSTVQKEEQRALAIAISPKDPIIAAGMQNGFVRFWNFIKELFYDSKSKHNGYITSVDFSPDGKLLASCSLDTTIRLWNVFSAEPFGKKLRWHGKPVQEVCFCSDKCIAACSDDRTISVGCLDDEEPILKLFGHDDHVVNLCFSRPMNVLISNSLDKTMRRWNASSGKQLGKPIDIHNGQVISMALSDDGRMLAVSLWDNDIVIIDVGSGAVVKRIPFVVRPFFESFSLDEVVFSDQTLVVAGTSVRMLRFDSFENLWLKMAVSCSIKNGEKQGLEKLLKFLKSGCISDDGKHSLLVKKLDKNFVGQMLQYLSDKIK